jgi:hypothetical protein
LYYWWLDFQGEQHIQANVDSAYFKLPIQFPEQTLIVRNEAFLPQIKVSYDLPHQQESIQTPLASRFCTIALCLARIGTSLV